MGDLRARLFIGIPLLATKAFARVFEIFNTGGEGGDPSVGHGMRESGGRGNKLTRL